MGFNGNMRWDQAVHLIFSLMIVLTFAAGIAVVASYRSQSGRVCLLLGLGMLVATQLLSMATTLGLALNAAQARDILPYLLLFNRMIYMTGVVFLVVGLRGVLQRSEFLETLHEESQDEFQ